MQLRNNRRAPELNSKMLNNIVDNYEQNGQHNIVASCFQQPRTSHNFLPCKYNVPFAATAGKKINQPALPIQDNISYCTCLNIS